MAGLGILWIYDLRIWTLMHIRRDVLKLEWFPLKVTEAYLQFASYESVYPNNPFAGAPPSHEVPLRIYKDIGIIDVNIPSDSQYQSSWSRTAKVKKPYGS